MVELNTWAGLEPAVMDIKTVSGLAQVFELTLTDSAGSAVELDGVTFRGAVNTAPLKEFVCSADGGKVLFGWAGLPAGRHSFDLYMVTGNAERVLVRGSMVVSGRVMPPLEQENYTVNDAATLVLPDTVDGTILVELSDVGLVDLLSRRTGAFAEEGKGHLEAIRGLKEWIDKKVDGFGDAAAAATSAIAEAKMNAVNAVTEDRGAAVEAISIERAAALKAVGDAGTAATSAIAEAKMNAVNAVTEDRGAAVEAISIERAAALKAVGDAGTAATSAIAEAKTDAEKSVSELVEKAVTAEGGAVQAATSAGDFATAASEASKTAVNALAAIPVVDQAGNMTLAGGMTSTGMINANGGINIPLVVGISMDTMAVNRAYALGVAQAAMMHQSRTYWLMDDCTATNGVTIDHLVPGCYCIAKISANGSTSLTMQTTGVVGGANYSKILGYSLPIRCDASVPGAWYKISILIGAGGEWTEHPDAGMDGYRFRPVAGSTPGLIRLVEITIYYDNGYRARVRELIGVGNPRSYVVRTTDSAFGYDHNSSPSAAGYRLVIAQSEMSYNDDLRAGVWLIMGGSASDTVIKLADIRGWDTYHTSGAPVMYLDAQAGEYGGVVQAEPPTILYGIGNNTYIEYGLIPYQRSWITSETETPFIGI